MIALAITKPLATPVQRDYVSWSAISTYQQCPLRYYFRYIEGLEETFTSASLALGGAVHSAVEFHFNELMVGNPAPDHDTLLNAFWGSWCSRAETAAIQLGKGEDLDAIGKTADRVITAFRASEFARPHGRIIGVEEELRSPLIPGLPEILGRIDLIVETDEALKIIDLKTARTRWSTEQAERSGEQLLLYAALAKDLVPGKPIQLEFAVVTKTASPVVETLPVAWDPTRIDRTQRVMAKVFSAIEAGNIYPSPSPTACPTCPFRSECDAWQG